MDLEITKCDGHGCLWRDDCYRYTSIADPFGQSWFAAPPKSGKDCEYFMEPVTAPCKRRPKKKGKKHV